MKITRKDSAMVGFGMLSAGEVFKDPSGDNILMKIHHIPTYPNGDVDAINAVDLETGESALYFDDDAVTPLKAELIVE